MEDEARPIQSALHVSTPRLSTQEGEQRQRKRRRVKRQKKQEELPQASFDIPGVKRIVVSPIAQRIIECVAGEDVTAENPWKFVRKEFFEDNLELQENESEFLPLKQELLSYPHLEILMGYIPEENSEYDEFYICLTVEAQERVSEIIAEIQKHQEERINNAVSKTVRPWKTRGSELEVNRLIVKDNRPLLEMELESQYPVISPKSQFRFRNVQDVKDGYVELVAGRATYQNVFLRRIDATVQVTPSVRQNEAQTTLTFPKHAVTQYEYESKSVKKLSKGFLEGVKSFIAENLESLNDMIYVNSYINFYKSDYLDLVKNERYTRDIDLKFLKEYISFIDIHLCKEKVISSVSWHSMWTGTLAIAYSEKAPCSYVKYKPNEDEVTKAIYEVIPVLFWCFSDPLHPKLFLETTREVTAISFCPFNEDLLVGGCTNGQVIIWDIRNKLENVEREEILTPAQQRYRTAMFSLMKWMKNTKDLKEVRLTALSDLKYSHTSAITAIKWISPYREVSKSGQIKTIPEEEGRTSLQFMTSSRDGTVLSWDLQANPIYSVGVHKRPKKLRRLKHRPSSLNVDISPLKAFNRILKPIFKVNVLAPGTSRNLPLTALNVRVTASEYEEKYPNPNRKFNITERIYFKPIFIRPNHPLVNQFVAGTSEGEFLIASWEGFSFNAGEVVNKENCKLENYGKYHDGPVVALARCEAFPDLVLTVGGKVFAVWKTDFIGQPVLWRRSRHRYTHGVWNTYRPSMFRLCRDDGYTEIWHLKTRSDRYQAKIPISGGTLLGTFTHPRVMKENVLGVADHNGSLRIFFIAQHLIQTSDEDKLSTHKICVRDADKKTKFLKWQEDWKNKHSEWIKLKKEEDERQREDRDEEAKRTKERLEKEQEQREKEEAMRRALLANPEPGKYTEWAQHQWRLREEKRMNRSLLTKKALDINMLEKQQLPLMKAIADEQKKKQKQDQRLRNANKLFNNTVAMLFPDVLEKKPPPTAGPYAGGDSAEVKAAYYETYSKIAEENATLVNKQRYHYYFDWHKILAQGKERRRILDGYYKRPSHRNRILMEKNNKMENALASYYKSPPTHIARGSEETLGSEAPDEEENAQHDDDLMP